MLEALAIPRKLLILRCIRIAHWMDIRARGRLAVLSQLARRLAIHACRERVAEIVQADHLTSDTLCFIAGLMLRFRRLSGLRDCNSALAR